MERVEIISVTTRSKTLTVKGGFYSAADMKSELSYAQFLALHSLNTCLCRDRIDKIVKWATEKKLVRPLASLSLRPFLCMPGDVSTMRMCWSTGSTLALRGF